MTERVALATKETFRSFEIRNFRLFFAGQGVSMIGTWLQLVAQALLVLRLTGSGVALGLVTFFQFTPVLLFGAWAGLLADRVDKRRLMLLTQSVMMTLAFVLGALVLTDRISVGLVYLLAALTGTAGAFDNPARRVMITELVPDSLAANAVSLNSALITGARVIGPALAGALISSIGIGWCFVANGLSFVAVLVALSRIDTTDLHASERVAKEKGQIRQGLRYVWADADLRAVTLMLAVVATLSFNWHVLFPLLAKDTFGGTDQTYTFITTVFGLGSVVGSLWIARRTSVTIRFIAQAAVWFGLTSALVAVAPNPALAAAAGALTGVASITFMSATMIAMQLGSVPAMRGRVMAIYTMLFLGSTPIGGPLAGWIAEHIGVRWGLGLGAVAALVTGLSALVLCRVKGDIRPQTDKERVAFAAA